VRKLNVDWRSDVMCKTFTMRSKQGHCLFFEENEEKHSYALNIGYTFDSGEGQFMQIMKHIGIKIFFSFRKWIK
jgi:hypothetical protein